MDKKRFQITLSVLDAVRNRFPETNEFIDSISKEECEKERMAVDEMWKGVADNKKTKGLSKEEIKKKLLYLMIKGEIVEFDDLNKEAEEVQDPEKAVIIIERHEDVIKTNRKGIIKVPYHQGQVFKRFKEKEKFAKLVSELGIHKTTIICKIIVFKLCKKYPKLITSSITLGFFKNYYKDIKAIFQENEN